jgi:hypothetical protein
MKQEKWTTRTSSRGRRRGSWIIRKKFFDPATLPRLAFVETPVLLCLWLPSARIRNQSQLPKSELFFSRLEIFSHRFNFRSQLTLLCLNRAQKVVDLPQDALVQVTTYYNEKINQLSTERDSLRTQLDSRQEELDSIRKKLIVNQQSYHLMRLDAARNLEKEKEKREQVEKELVELKNKIRCLV